VNEMRICANGEKVFVIQMSAAATKILAALDLDVTRKEGGSTNFEKLLDSVNWNYKLAGLQTLRLQTVENLRSKSLLLDNGQHVGQHYKLQSCRGELFCTLQGKFRSVVRVDIYSMLHFFFFFFLSSDFGDSPCSFRFSATTCLANS